MSQAEMLTPGKPARWRRVLRDLSIAVAVLAVLLFALPYLVSWPPVRNLLLRAASGPLNGSAKVDRVALGWFAPLEVDGLEIQPADGPPLVAVRSIQADKPWWKLLIEPDAMGQVRIDQPQARLWFTRQGNNFAEVFSGLARQVEPAARPDPFWHKLGVSGRLSGGSFYCRGHGEQEWSIGPINLAVELLPASATARGVPEVVVRPGALVEHAAISQGMCNDLLKFVAPVLADATAIEGDVSIEIGGAAVPLAMPDLLDLDARGTVSLHSVKVGAGQNPLVRAIAGAISRWAKIPPMVQLAHETDVRFDVHNRVVRHDNLRFGVGDESLGLAVQTSGTVGFDEALDLKAVLQLHIAEREGTGQGQALVRALNRRPLELSIEGTLREPKVKPIDVAQSGVALLLSTLDEVDQAQGIEPGSLLEKVRRLGILGAELLDDSRPAADGQPRLDPAAELPAAAVDALQELIRRRRQRKGEQPPPSPSTGERGSPGEAPPRTGPLRRALRGLLERDDRPPESHGGDRPPPAEGSP